jgi:FkbM family methyltransferase
MKLFLEVCFRNLYYFFSNKEYRNFYKLLFLYGDRPRYKALQIGVSGYKIKVPDALSFIWQYKEIFVDQSYLFQAKSKNPVIIDCGSNIGLSALFYHTHYPNASVYCIEADQEIAKVLSQNIKANNSKAEVIAKAAWIHDQGVSFSSEGSDSGSVGNGNSTIPSLDLNAFLNEFSEIEFLKMDIEGAENVVIPHCKETLKKINTIFLEYHGNYAEPQKLDELLSILKGAGFHYFIKTENKRKSPFINLHKDRMYDLQLNIYGYRFNENCNH